VSPDANLDEQRRLRARLLHACDHGRALDPDDVARLCELVAALDAWVQRGGFLPRAWGGAPK
jgi:hypothetical protein